MKNFMPEEWKETNLKALMAKYIHYLHDVEGTDFIDDCDRRFMSEVIFTDEEWGYLSKLSAEVVEKHFLDKESKK